MKGLWMAGAAALALGGCAGTSDEAAAPSAMASGVPAAAAAAAPMRAADYVTQAALSDMYEIQSSQLALSKAKSDAVKQFAREMIQDHKTTTKTLMAALPKTSPQVPKPPKTLSQPNQTKIDQLRQASGAGFDQLYLQQQMQAHQQAWALHKGYATDGSDPALRQVATAAVPIIEKHLQHLKAMPAGSGM